MSAKVGEHLRYDPIKLRFTTTNPNTGAPESILEGSLNQSIAEIITPSYHDASPSTAIILFEKLDVKLEVKRSVSTTPFLLPQPPPSEPDATPTATRGLKIKLEDFCDRYEISDSDCRKLRDLEYVPGISQVEKLPVEEWKGVGFTWLGWEGFLKAHTECLRDIAVGRWDVGGDSEATPELT